MTRLTFSTAALLLLCCTYSWRTGCAENCLHSRLDFMDCTPHQDTSWPGPNEYALYRTYIRSRIPDCKYRNPKLNNFEIIRPIDDLGSRNVRLLYSPGYLLNRRYANKMLVRYNVQCPKGRIPFLVYNDLRVRGKECYGRCEDYVNVSSAAFGSTESCGKVPTDSYYYLDHEHFSVVFRTSQKKNDIGFLLSVTCFKPERQDSKACTNFDGKEKRDLEIYRNMWRERVKSIRGRYIFPGPLTFPTLPIRPTPRLTPLSPLLPLRVEVALKDVVIYRDSTITVSRGGKVVRRIRNIFRLVVRDASGGDHSFTRDAVDLRLGEGEETLRLRGPGELLLLSSSSTFLMDSQPFALSASEKQVMKDLTDELFNLIPSSNDLFITDITDEDDLQLFKRRRSAALPPIHHRLVRISIIHLALVHSNSCNPVVKSAATSTLSIATRQSPSRVESVRENLLLQSGWMSAAINPLQYSYS